jgi:hypothetical protein
MLPCQCNLSSSGGPDAAGTQAASVAYAASHGWQEKRDWRVYAVIGSPCDDCCCGRLLPFPAITRIGNV